MITNNEINAVKLSATKKDYYQIWNELIEVAGKISDRWDPATTNESDPGIVLLKVLTAIADKINYNIDVNTLEAFMPSAAQTESMRNLCEMMGYNIKYYQSASTEINIKYVGDEKTQFEEINEITLPMFTTVSNQEKDVNYVTLEAKNFSADNKSQTVVVMEGQHVQCETINNNVITIDMLDDNNRFYLPENQIAENGIFIYRISDGVKSGRWEKVESLYTEHFNNLIYKFGYDSKEARPYVQFPDDIGQIIEDGLEIHYIRTSGIAGNIAAYTLSTFELPSGTEWQGFSAENDFTINQLSAANNGANIESISDAYKSFKRTVGTFETLVTCRDYMNKIYNLMEDTNVPMVSNIIVSDIRDDINRSVTLCGFSDFGVCYTEKSVVENGEDLIDHFDLLLYPFTTVYGYDNRLEYESSFIYNADNGYSIKRELEDCKTIAHKIKFPNEDEIALIKNYLKLDARIVTTEKISIQEEIVILNAIKTAIYKNFNLRKLDFSEEIPFDNILDVIENADPRIKNVVLYEPTLLTKFALVDGREFEVGSVIAESVDGDFIVPRFIGKELYNKLTLRNVLAGRLELFNYNTKFKYFLNEGKAKKPVIDENGNVKVDINSGKVVYDTDDTGANAYYASVYPNENTTLKQITSIEPRFKLGSVQSDETQGGKKVVIPENYELTRNQEIKFRSPNLITKATYPAYVNYFLKLTTTEAVAAVPARFTSLYDYLNEENNWQDLLDNEIYGEGKGYNLLKLFKAIAKTDGKYKGHEEYINDYGAIFKYNLTTKKYEILKSNEALDENIAYYSIEPSDVSFLVFKNFLKSRKLDLYRALELNTSRIPGYLVDEKKYKYQEVTKNFGYTTKNYYVPIELGTDAKYASLPKDGEYQLRSGEYLLINYTPSSSSQTEDGTLTNSEGEPISIYYGEGCIIKPNFELVDSESLVTAKLKAYSKKGVDFKTCEKNGKVIEGLNLDKVNMLGLNANEKIEYRDIAHIILDKRYNLYWALTDIEVAKEELIKNDYKYILKDNEYFFIASAEKDSMTYYGSGTELKLSKEDSKFFEGVDSSISLDEILLNGVAGIPWVSRLFDESNNLIITEYKYVTLTEGDKLVEITGLNEELSNKWQSVKDVKYTSGDETKYLPKINIKDLYWEAQCLLIMQTNSNSSIKLVSGETLTLKGLDANGNPCRAEDEITIHGTDDYPAVIRSSYIVNGAYEKINTKIDEYTDNTGAKIINDFKISVSNEYPLGMVDTSSSSSYTDPSIVKLHNFDKNLTSVYFNKFTDKDNYIEFNLNIPSDCYGLIMIYYARSGKLNSEDGSYLVANTPKLSIFNYVGAEETGWWDGGKVDNKATGVTQYYLKPGINVIKVNSLINNIKIYPNKKLDHSIIFSDLDVVYTDNDINLELLDYQMIPNTSWASIDRDKLVKIKNSGKNIKDSIIEYNSTNKTALYYPEGLEYKLLKVADNITYYEEVKGNLENSETNPRAIARDQLLMALRALDPNNEFYYNCLPDNSIAIDINTNLLGTEDAETMSSPMIWYDSNNINNKFVVSEIDALYLEDGIKIVRSSRR